MDNYITLCKPTLSKALLSIGLDKKYFKASGNYLYYRNSQGEEVEVLDLLGGYGATLIGHFHPQIGSRYKDYIEQKVPFHNQFSIREGAGELSTLLNSRLCHETNYRDGFQFCYTSTGAETMEIALKHAEYARSLELNAMQQQLKADYDSLNPQYSYHLLPQQERLLGVSRLASSHVIKQALVRYNTEQFNKHPIFIALENAFHGKMMLTANCTHHPMYRAFLRCLNIETRFLSAHVVNEIVHNIEHHGLWGEALQPEVIDGVIHLKPLIIRRVVAILAEPVQGEGGVWPLNATVAEDLNKLRDSLHCPLIADEVQSGSGRCGMLVAASNIGLNADYYALSKALGAGYVKIGVVAIKKSHIASGFDLIQSSTFGEDDLSCKVARDYLELLFNGDDPLIKRVGKISEQLGKILDQLKNRFPDVIKDVRYQGLLLGIEFNDVAESSSYLMQNIAAQRSLGYIIAGHLLNAYNIRVAPSGSSENVLRFEPSVYLEQRHISLLQRGLERICLGIRYADVGFLLRPIINKGTSSAIQPKDYRLTASGIDKSATPADFSVTFVNHLISAAGLRDVEPSFEGFSDKELEVFLLNTSFNLSTVPFPASRIRNKYGKTVDFIIHPIPVTSQMIAHALEKNNLTQLRAEINQRIDFAMQNGSRVAGLGMFTSIITNNGKSVKNNSITVTTGNALTVGMSIAAVKKAFGQRDLACASLSVIGAAGNIGSVYAEILGAECRTLRLLGSSKQDSLLRLKAVMYNIYAHYYDDFSTGKTYPVGSLAARLADVFNTMQPDIHQQCHTPSVGRCISDYLAEHYPAEMFISISQQIDDVTDSDIIICATNATNSILPLGQLRQKAVVCDIAVPHNVLQDDLIDRPDILLLRGGVVKTPYDDGLDPRIRAYLEGNQLYACMTETILLALEECTEHYSYGNITPEQVENVMQLADKHGFVLEDVKRESSL
ncbi:aminotransferase class III-fold pyridoxal phosphate-dependent enzyme [Jejubacter calystegiae]|uniref:Aminotransferase class III-fold pyridoxal phosphate-dependent enzyme n=1 Tax=Jejubacter calystegiae TaxID=2579935 RepID=A0A4P8YIW0_9ENTR|nr:aminotransferase class III-fold pyridoxal phosphate-dependent enzyme [Jejubacter calystegiae]QCT19983.1 aminotransferase class III-fold pyridoxal phosphate-dependent enzyme [Jejubacter calystegiae]